MQLRRRRFASFAFPGLLSPALFAGCSSSVDPALYTIPVRPGPVSPSGPRIVLLRDVGLASYLDRKEIVRSSDGYRLDVMANDWWGEPLGTLLGRVVVVGLSQRLPNSTVYGERGAISSDPNAVVAINVQRLDVNQAGRLELLAQAAVEFNRPKRSAARNFSIARPVPTPNTAGQVAAIADAVAEFTDGLAALLQP